MDPSTHHRGVGDVNLETDDILTRATGFKLNATEESRPAFSAPTRSSAISIQLKKHILAMSRETNQPCPTLYVNNIESKIKKIGAYQLGILCTATYLVMSGRS
jgi:lysine/ornithine N-monooxygenase